MKYTQNIILFENYFFGTYCIFLYYLKGIYLKTNSKNAIQEYVTLKTNFQNNSLAKTPSEISLNKSKLMNVYFPCHSKSKEFVSEY